MRYIVSFLNMLKMYPLPQVNIQYLERLVSFAWIRHRGARSCPRAGWQACGSVVSLYEKLADKEALADSGKYTHRGGHADSVRIHKSFQQRRSFDISE